MTPTQYTSLEVSRLIESKLPEVETDAWILVYANGREDYGYGTKTYTPIRVDEFGGSYTFVNRYRLDDVIRAIRVYQKNIDLWELYNGQLCQRLLTAYLPSLSMQDPEVERVIREVFE